MSPDFSKYSNGLVPTIVQDLNTAKVLMLGFMNEEAFERTKEEGKVVFYSRSKERLWMKGEVSGNYLNVKEVLLDCDFDSLLIKVEPIGPVCHSGADTCFNEVNRRNDFVVELEDVISSRLKDPVGGSYTSSLFAAGINKIAQKLGEEAVEMIIEAKDDNDERFLEEGADLFFHYLLLLQAKGKRLDDVIQVLQSRNRK